MSESKHTPGPIQVVFDTNIMASDNYPLTANTGTNAANWHERNSANAKRAVVCWNAHDDLLASCKEMLAYIESTSGIKEHELPGVGPGSYTLVARAAIAKAEGTP